MLTATISLIILFCTNVSDTHPASILLTGRAIITAYKCVFIQDGETLCQKKPFAVPY